MIPHFRCTEEAVAFGKRATVEEVRVMKNIRDMDRRVMERLKISGKDIKIFDLRMKFAVNAQFMQEAIKAAKGSNGRR